MSAVKTKQNPLWAVGFQRGGRWKFSFMVRFRYIHIPFNRSIWIRFGNKRKTSGKIKEMRSMRACSLCGGYRFVSQNPAILPLSSENSTFCLFVWLSGSSIANQLQTNSLAPRTGSGNWSIKLPSLPQHRSIETPKCRSNGGNAKMLSIIFGDGSGTQLEFSANKLWNKC